MSQYAPKKPRRINSVSVTMFLVAAAIGYFGWFYLPHWFAVWSASGRLIVVARAAYREYDDEKLMEKVVQDVRASGLRVTSDNFAVYREPWTPEELNGFPEGPREVQQRRGKAFTITMAYSVDATWPLLDSTTTLTFNAERTADLTGKL